MCNNRTQIYISDNPITVINHLISVFPVLLIFYGIMNVILLFLLVVDKVYIF